MIGPDNQPLSWPFAQNLYGLKNGIFGYLIPKPKFLFYVDFVISTAYQLDPSEQSRVGYLVKNVDRPKFNYKTQEVDQYNRKRVFYTKVDYQNITISFNDVVDSIISKMIDDHNRMNFGDFSNFVQGDGGESYEYYWKNNAIDGNDMRYWGYRLKNPSNWTVSLPGRNFTVSENYFTEVRIYEFFGNSFTQFTLMNPKIESIFYDQNDSSSSDGNEISMILNPEGIVYNYINAPIEISALASSILPGPGFTTYNFPISDINPTATLVGSLISAGGGLLTGLIDGIFGNYGSTNNSLGLSSGIGILGGAALTAASAGYFGPSLAKTATPQNLFLADSFLSVSNIVKNNIIGTGGITGVGTISGFGSNSVSVGTGGTVAMTSHLINNIESLI